MNSFQLAKCDRDTFVSSITSDKRDSFAKTFVAKADMQKYWDNCIGAFLDGKLVGAVIVTVSKRTPHVANLQLLHTFAEYRGNGIGKMLCECALQKAIESGAEYFRVSAEIPAIPFYKKIGFKFLGKQKSGCQLSIFKINGSNFSEGIYDLEDKVVFNAVHKKGKGGCVEVFDVK